MDFLTKRERSALMSRIRGKNTGIERVVFALLRRSGLKFAKHAKVLPGCPDAVIHDAKLAVFVDGDFWHGRNFVRWRARVSPTWRLKIEMNMARDESKRRKLRRLGWRVVRVWGKDVARNPNKCLAKILRHCAGRGIDAP